jgi:hypothetical protein
VNVVGRFSLVGEEGGTPFVEVLGGSFSSGSLEVVAELVVAAVEGVAAAEVVVDVDVRVEVPSNWEDRQRRAEWWMRARRSRHASLVWSAKCDEIAGG